MMTLVVSDAADARLSIVEAFLRLLPHYGSARRARQRLHEALQLGGNEPGGVRLWVRDKLVDPEWYDAHMRVRRQPGDPEGVEGAELWPTGALPVAREFTQQLWSVSAADIDALIRHEQEAAAALDRLDQELRIMREALIALEQDSGITKEAVNEVKRTLDKFERDSGVTKETLDELKQGLIALDRVEQDSNVTKETVDGLRQRLEQAVGVLDELKQQAAPRNLGGRGRVYDRERLIAMALVYGISHGWPDQLKGEGGLFEKLGFKIKNLPSENTLYDIFNPIVDAIEAERKKPTWPTR